MEQAVIGTVMALEQFCRHCERSEAIHLAKISEAVHLWRKEVWIASSPSLLAKTPNNSFMDVCATPSLVGDDYRASRATNLAGAFFSTSRPVSAIADTATMRSTIPWTSLRSHSPSDSFDNLSLSRMVWCAMASAKCRPQ